MRNFLLPWLLWHDKIFKAAAKILKRILLETRALDPVDVRL
jgi:hypothetical protein